MSGLWNALGALKKKMKLAKQSQQMDGGHNLHYDNADNSTTPSTCTTSTTQQSTTIATERDLTRNSNLAFDVHDENGSSPVEDIYNISSAANLTEKLVRPVLARRLAKAAALTTVLMHPVKELFSMMTSQTDVLEVACSPTSELTATFEQAGYRCLRANYRNGFDLDTRRGTSYLGEKIEELNPKLVWVSMACTRLTSLQNLTPRTPEQWDAFMKRRGQDLRLAGRAAGIRQ